MNRNYLIPMDNDDNGNKEIKSMIKYISRPEKRCCYAYQSSLSDAILMIIAITINKKTEI